MSSAEVAAKVVRSIEHEEFKILTVLTGLLRNYESVTITQLATKTRMHVDKATFSINKLNQMGLVVKRLRGYSLVMAGLDALALKILVDRDIIIGMGSSIGAGKESDVFDAFTPAQEVLAIKFFRIGRTSFRDVKRKRSFSGQLHHWLLVNISAAKREFNALKMLHKSGVKVPTPYALAKHVIVMERIQGSRLIHCDELKDPRHMLESVLDNVRLALKVDLISADLSEYNVLYDGSNVWIIDWPQSISVKHPNADTLLKRDIQNMLKFFKKKYGLKYELTDALNYVRG